MQNSIGMIYVWGAGQDNMHTDGVVTCFRNLLLLLQSPSRNVKHKLPNAAEYNVRLAVPQNSCTNHVIDRVSYSRELIDII